jgi:hypothetical protein
MSVIVNFPLAARFEVIGASELEAGARGRRPDRMRQDFGVARDYVVFPSVPLCGVGIDALKAGTPRYAWDSSKPIYLGVLPAGKWRATCGGSMRQTSFAHA